MRKDTKADPQKKSRGEAAPPEKPRRGRPKRKVQISVRIDRDVMAAAYKFIGETGFRITDLLERGLVMAMKAEGTLPAVSSEVRFLVGRASAEQQELTRCFLAQLMMPEVRGLSRLEQVFRTAVFDWLQSTVYDSHFDQALRAYGVRSEVAHEEQHMLSR